MSARCGYSHHNAKVREEVVRRARDMREAGKTYGQISMRLRVPYFTVRDWLTGRTRAGA